MKISVYTIVLAMVLGACRPNPPPDTRTYSSDAAQEDITDSSEVRDYQPTENRYIIVVAQKDNMTDATVKDIARQRAADLATDKGFCYYIIEKEETVRMLESDKSDFYNQQNPPPDLYEQHIQRKDLRRNGIVDFNSNEAKRYPAYQMTIRLYKTSPGYKAVKVC